jgi:hypothetical protein
MFVRILARRLRKNSNRKMSVNVNQTPKTVSPSADGITNLGALTVFSAVGYACYRYFTPTHETKKSSQQSIQAKDYWPPF